MIYMSEQVVTGGLKTFNYGKDVELRLDDERKKDIKEAYDKYYQRKEVEKRKKRISWVLLIIVLLIALVLLWIWMFNR